MTTKRYNKATAAVLAGAATTAIAAMVAIDADALAAFQTLLTAVLVWLVPNGR